MKTKIAIWCCAVTWISLSVISCQKQSNEESSRLDEAFESVIADTPRDSQADGVRNTSFIAKTGERIQRLELLVEASLQEVWDAFTTEEGIRAWQVPVVQLDFRIGGTQKSIYNKDAQVGNEGTITNDIVSIMPMELLVYHVNLTEALPEKARNEDENLQYILQFEEWEKGRVTIVFSMFGWGEGKEWTEIYDKFEAGNRWTFEQLIRRFTEGPVDWNK